MSEGLQLDSTEDKAKSLREARLAAMDLLARREHSFVELQRKLALKSQARAHAKTPSRLDDPLIVEAALLQLRDEGLQSDERFCEAYVRYRAERGFGPIKIKNELREKGIAASDSEDAIAASACDWYELCQVQARKKYGAAPPQDLKQKAKQLRFLISRGFDAEQCAAVFSLDDWY